MLVPALTLKAWLRSPRPPEIRSVNPTVPDRRMRELRLRGARSRYRERLMAVFVLVHGGAHGGWCFQPLARVLRDRGHRVYTPTLTGLGERAHLFRADVDLDCHIDDI